MAPRKWSTKLFSAEPRFLFDLSTQIQYSSETKPRNAPWGKHHSPTLCQDLKALKNGFPPAPQTLPHRAHGQPLWYWSYERDVKAEAAGRSSFCSSFLGPNLLFKKQTLLGKTSRSQLTEVKQVAFGVKIAALWSFFLDRKAGCSLVLVLPFHRSFKYEGSQVIFQELNEHGRTYIECLIYTLYTGIVVLSIRSAAKLIWSNKKTYLGATA